MADLDRRLTTLDSASLYFEKSNEPMHIGACSVYDGDFHLMSQLGDRIPPVWQALPGMFSVPSTLFNTVSTNFPGPQIPLYLGGSELLDWYPHWGLCRRGSVSSSRS
jgi:hypothetical protein